MASAAVSAPDSLHASPAAAARSKRGRRIIFRPTLDQLRQGVFEGTEASATHDGITLAKESGGSHRPGG